MTSARVVRGCGTRQPGGAYLVASLGEGGVPIEDLVVDPPIPVVPDALGLATVGMLLAQKPTGEALVIDWVGAQHYPQPADYVEEISLFGSSRRIPTSFDFAKLGPGAEHLLVHPRASLANIDWPLHARVFDRQEAPALVPGPRPGPAGAPTGAPSRATTPRGRCARPCGGNCSIRPRYPGPWTSRTSRPSASG